MTASGSLRRVFLGSAVAIVSTRALGAPHLEPCDRVANDYEERVERLLRDAWPEEMQLLAIEYLPLTERGIGLTRDEDGFNLIRLQFDRSFWYSSWRDVKPGTGASESANAAAVATEVHRADGGALGAQVLDFADTKVRVSKLSIPISDALGTALLNAFRRSADAARVRDKRADLEEIVLDGYKFEVLLDKRACVQLADPPSGSEADKIARLIRFIDDKSLSWRPAEQKTFEADVRAMIPN